MRIVVVPGPEETEFVRTDDAGAAQESLGSRRDAAEFVRTVEAAEHPRWVWADAPRTYASWVRRGVRVQRCHDLALAGAILAMRVGLTTAVAEPLDDRPGLFEAARYPSSAELVGRQREQLETIGSDPALRLLVAAESAGGAAAVEMSYDGLPFSASRHRAHLEANLGGRPRAGDLPGRLIELENEISAVFGRRVNPSSPVEVVAAFGRAGIELTSTRSWILKDIDHPAVPLLLRHRDLSKLFSTNGWAWLDSWVDGDRFRPVYVPGGVVSGRWASRGGGALQIPKALRSSVIADSGHTFVVADAGQLEPRILAAMSGDRRMVAAAGTADLYRLIADESFAGDRAKAKVAILGVLYGATSGEAKSLLTLLRAKFPVAVDHVENAAQAGERGEVVYSWLGRACPPPSAQWWSTGDAHARGRFTRNFVVQATASEWALCLLADLRRRCADHGGELVFFQHDEVVVHTRDPEQARRDVLDSAAAATRLLFGDTGVRFPMDVAVRDCYADPDRPADPDGSGSSNVTAISSNPLLR